MSKYKSTRALLTLLGIGASSAATMLVAKKVISSITPPKLDLRGKVVLITGGSRGLGFALCEELGAQGCRFALCARNAEELEQVRERLASKNIEAATFVCDISERAEIESLMERVIEHFGRVDVLINNAGMIKVGPFDAFELSDFEYAMSVMFWAPVNLTFAVLPHMRRQGNGSIVNITSIGGRVSVPHLLPYSCAKFALVGFSTGLSTELHTEGIHVLTVVPGLMRTGSYLNAEFTGPAEKEFAWFGILGNLPGFSVAAQYAASCIRGAVENQRRICTISVPAKLIAASEALAPELTRRSLEFVNRTLLPRSNNQKSSFSGKQLNNTFGKLYQAVTWLGQAAALRFNERN